MSELIQRMPAVVQTIRLSDLVDIAILSIVIYKLLWMVRKTSSGRVLRGIMIVVVAIWASAEFNLYATSFVLNRVVEYAILVLVILFQPEIRRFLERVGSSRMSKVFVQPPEAAHDIDSAISQTVEAYTSLSKDKVGALMVFERANLLDEVIKTGTALQEMPLSELQEAAPQIQEDVYAELTSKAAVNRRTSLGGTAVSNVLKEVARDEKIIADHENAAPSM